MRIDQLSGDHQSPGSCIDKERGALAQMSLPVAAAQLVADQCITGSRIGDAQ